MAATLRYPTPKYPRQVRLDTTTDCNAKCLSCHRFLYNRSGFMPFPAIEKILKDISAWEYPLQEIVPVNYGEFFLRPDWPEILKAIETVLPETSIVIPTNGSTMTKEALEVLAGIKTLAIVNFSLNGLLGVTYTKFMGLPESNIERIEGAVRFLQKNRPDISIWASMVYDPVYQTDKEKDMFINYWGSVMKASPQILPASNCGRIKQEIVTDLPCRSIFSDLVIGSDNKLSSCCFDAGFTLDLGEYKGNVLKAWNNPKLVKLRNTHNEGLRAEIKLCRGCSFA